MEILNFFLPAVLASLTMLLTDASKWWTTGVWSWDVFWSTKIKPLLLSLGLSVVIYFALLYVPFLQPALEALAEYQLTEVTAFTLMGMATALIDNLTKKRPSVEEQKMVVEKYSIDVSTSTLDNWRKQ